MVAHLNDIMRIESSLNRSEPSTGQASDGSWPKSNLGVNGWVRATYFYNWVALTWTVLGPDPDSDPYWGQTWVHVGLSYNPRWQSKLQLQVSVHTRPSNLVFSVWPFSMFKLGLVTFYTINQWTRFRFVHAARLTIWHTNLTWTRSLIPLLRELLVAPHHSSNHTPISNCTSY